MGSLVQFSLAAGEGRALQTDIAVWGEHSPCSGHTGFAPYRGVCAFPMYTAQAPGCSIWSGPALSAVPVFGSSIKARIQLRLRVVSSPASAVQAARGSGALSPDVVRLFPTRRAAQAARGLAPSPRCGAPFPSAESGSGSQRLACPLPWRGAPFPSVAPAHAAVGSQEVFR